MTTVVDSYRFIAPGGGSFTPADLPSLAGWWDASDAGSFTYSSGVLVSQWNDLSGNGRHFVQADTSKQPSRNATQNSLDCIAFNGTDETMATASFTLAQPLTMIFVIDIPSDRGVLSSVGGNLQSYVASSNTQMRMFAGGSEAIAATSPPAVTGLNLWVLEFNGASSNAWQNGTQEGTSINPGTSGTTTGLRLGERNLGTFFRDKLMEIIVCDAVLGTSDRQDAENYLATKWGTP